MSKTPYELRFDTLMLARDFLQSQYDADVTRLHFVSDEWQRQEQSKSLKYPTLDNVTDTALKLKEFVDGNFSSFLKTDHKPWEEPAVEHKPWEEPALADLIKDDSDKKPKIYGNTVPDYVDDGLDEAVRISDYYKKMDEHREKQKAADRQREMERLQDQLQLVELRTRLEANMTRTEWEAFVEQERLRKEAEHIKEAERMADDMEAASVKA